MTELRHIGVMQAGKYFAIQYALFEVVFLPYILMAMLKNPESHMPLSAMIVFLFLAGALLPFVGFVAGVIVAILYNVTARLGGGLQFEFVAVVDSNEPAAEQAPHVPTES